MAPISNNIKRAFEILQVSEHKQLLLKANQVHDAHIKKKNAEEYSIEGSTKEEGSFSQNNRMR